MPPWLCCLNHDAQTHFHNRPGMFFLKLSTLPLLYLFWLIPNPACHYSPLPWRDGSSTVTSTWALPPFPPPWNTWWCACCVFKQTYSLVLSLVHFPWLIPPPRVKPLHSLSVYELRGSKVRYPALLSGR